MTDKPGYRRPQEGTQPEYLHPAYQSTNRRSPSKPLVFLPHSLSEITGPTIGAERIKEQDNDLTAQHKGQPQGERIIVHGRVLDENGLPVPGILVEIWQANAAGRYNHDRDLHDAPLDPNFTGTGRTVTDADGWYQFQTIKPGAYPWGNHHNAWRPAHIHFSLFGPSILTRLVTQMYFPGDPLLAYDPIYNCVPDTRAKERLIASFDLEKPSLPMPSVIAGTSSCAAAKPRRWRNKMTLNATTSHTVGPYYHIGLTWLNRENLTVEHTLGERVAITGQVVDGNGDVVNDAMLEVWQANAAGKYDHPEDDQDKPLDPNFEGFGRVPVDAEGRFRFTTIKPGTVEGLKGTTQAPHLVVLVFARGLVKHLLTRIYFDGEPANVADPLLECVPADRRTTLLAKKDALGVYQWNVILQGTDAETVFFDY